MPDKYNRKDYIGKQSAPYVDTYFERAYGGFISRTKKMRIYKENKVCFIYGAIEVIVFDLNHFKETLNKWSKD